MAMRLAKGRQMKRELARGVETSSRVDGISHKVGFKWNQRQKVDRKSDILL